MSELAEEIQRRRLKFADVVEGQFEMLSEEEHDIVVAALERCGHDGHASAEAQARTIARAICVEYRLSPERYEPSGGEHPIIHVIVKHVAPALAKLSGDVGEQVVLRQQETVKRMIAESRDPLRYCPHCRALQPSTLTKLDPQEGA